MQQFETITLLDTWPVEFDREGHVLYPKQVTDVVNACANATDLLVLSHGWNNDEEEANGLYHELLGNLGAPNSSQGRPRKLIVLRVYWPSKRFAEADLIAGGSASLADALTPIVAQIDALLHDYPVDGQQWNALQALKAAVPNLEQDENAQEEFVRLVRFLFSPHANEEEEVLQAPFFESEPGDLLRRLARRFRPDQTKEGAASLRILQDSNLSDEVVAAGLGNVFGGVLNGARNLLNLFTYYEMKERAGAVGGGGLHDVLRQIRSTYPALRIHLCGHSFGGRLVTAAAAAMDPSDQTGQGIASMMLLQAAFSHNGFGLKFDGQHDGFFRGVLQGNRISGPIVVTYSKLDLAVGLAYPIASRLRNQVASGLGDASDPYGGIGRNGALFVGDALDTTEAALRPASDPYQPFRAGRIYNLESAQFIKSHGDVRGSQVAAALRHAIG